MGYLSDTRSGSSWVHQEDEGVLLVILPVVLVFHLAGIILVSFVIKRKIHKIQHFLLLNYSVGVVATGLALLADIMVHRTSLKEKFKDVFNIWPCIFYKVLYCSMVYITLDRLLEVLLSIKYPVYVTVRRVIKLVTITWFIAVSTGITLSLSTRMHRMMHAAMVYVKPTIDVVYSLFVIVSYLIIFHYFKKSRLPPSGYHARVSVLAVFRRSKFSISLMLVISFVLFIVAPDIIVSIRGVYDRGVALLVIDICFFVSSVSDAVLYTSMDNEIRKIMRKISRAKRQNHVVPIVRTPPTI